MSDTSPQQGSAPAQPQSQAWRRATNILIAGATLLVLVLSLSMDHRIPANHGLGYDGKRYGFWAKRLDIEMLLLPWAERPRALRLNDYTIHRIGPSMLIHYGMKALEIKPGGQKILRAFILLNLFALTLGVFFFCLAADELRVPGRGKWLGWVAIMLSYANLKMPVYYAPLTDSSAFCLGAASLLLFLKRRAIGQLLLIFVGSFVWPTLPYFGTLLVAFPRATSEDPDSETPRAARAAAAATAVGALAFIAFLITSGYKIKTTPVTPFGWLIPVSALFCAAYLYLALRSLLDSSQFWEGVDPRRLIKKPWPWVAVLAFAGARLMVGSIDTPSWGMTGQRAISDNFFSALAQPGTFWVAHALYFGPLILLLVMLWGPISKLVQRQGPGLVLCFGLAVVLGAGSESRKLVNFLPFLVLFAVSAASEISTRPARLAVLTAASLVFSKIWLPMTQPIELPWVGEIAWRTLYVSSRGPWLNHDWYLAQLPFVLAMAWLLWRWTAADRASRSPTVPAQAGRESTSANRSL